MGQNREAGRGGKGQNQEKRDGEMRKLKRTEINRIRIRHQQEVESDYPYAGKRVPQLFVRYLCGSCPVLVRSFIEQLSNNYRTTIEQLSNKCGTSMGRKRGKGRGIYKEALRFSRRARMERKERVRVKERPGMREQ